MTPAQVPAEMAERAQWVTWRFMERGGKRTKVPFDPSTGHMAKVNDPSTWATLEGALSAASSYDGIGFVFAPDRAFTGIDLDHVLDRDGRIRIPALVYLVRDANTYTEVSPSGSGLHLYFHGGIPDEVKRTCKTKGEQPGGWAVEVYDCDRFFTFTGNRFEVGANG